MKLFYAGLTATLLAGSLNAQQAPLFSVGGDPVSAEEFMAVYNKNKEVGQSIDPKTPEEYLDLYINFKLKVKEATDLGLDTNQSFLREFESYRKQLSQPYLADKQADEDLLREAYERLQQEVRARHIMLELAPDALPEDTLKVWNELMAIRQRIEKGEPFEKLAMQYSKDTYSAKRGGDLGYFTVFNMVYPFETACYTQPVGQVSRPVRTQFGYHLIEVTDRMPARGTVQVAHIMVIANEKSTDEQRKAAELKINEIYDKLMGGADFATMARQYSDDKTSAANGGMLQPFGINVMVEEFESAAFSLEVKGKFTQPVKSPYGWHIIKLMDRKGIGSFEEMEAELRQKVQRDTRSSLGKERFIARLKKEYGFEEKYKNLKKLIGAMDSTFMKGEWKPDEKTLGSLGKKELFVLDGKEYTLADYASYLMEAQRGSKKSATIEQEVYKLYPRFVEKTVMAYEESQLVNKYPDYRLLVQEYHDGILLFDLTEKRIWNRSVKDTAGLEEFFGKNISNYQWPERVSAQIFTCANLKLATQVVSMLKKGTDAETIRKELNAESQLNVHLASGTYGRDDHPVLKTLEWKKGISSPTENNDQVVVVNILEVLPAGPKKLEEVRGLATSDYQKQLEEEWIRELREKYSVKVNNEVKARVMEKLNS